MDLPLYRDQHLLLERRRVTAIARRLAVVRWMLPERHHGAIARLAHALRRAAEIRGAKPPERVRLLGPEEGRAWLSREPLSRWIGGRTQSWLEARSAEAAIHAATREAWLRHGFLDFEGGALVLLPGCLPLDQTLLRERLTLALRDEVPFAAAERQRPADAVGLPIRARLRRDLPRSDSGLVGALVDRILHDCGAMLVAAASGTEEDENPFLPQLMIYEEGFFPLDLEVDDPILWLPMAR